MNVMNLHAVLSSPNYVAIDSGHRWSDAGQVTMVLNDGIISYNRSAGTRYLSVSPLSMPLTNNTDNSFLCADNSSGAIGPTNLPNVRQLGHVQPALGSGHQ